MYGRGGISSRRRTRRGLTRADVVVILVVLVGVAFVLLPALALVLGRAHRGTRCGSNLRMIAQAAMIYQSENRSPTFPRTCYDPARPTVNLYTGAGPAAPPRENDVTAALCLLLRVLHESLDGSVIVCPSDDAEPLERSTLATLSNFPNGRANLSYSFANPYPSAAANRDGWVLRQESGPEVPLVADMNPGNRGAAGPSHVGFAASMQETRPANSPNHWFYGQNVAYCDGHVEWTSSPFVGRRHPARAWRDNIYVNAEGVDESGRGGLTHGPPVDAYDGVLLPTSADGPQPPFPARTPAMAAPEEPRPYSPTAVVAGAVVVVAGVSVLVARRGKRRRRTADPAREGSRA